ncbi:Mob1/phocein [Neolentinus lepideus HHB14362 ss-1]|uniref:Mob1/phocein n=1 Tax=Neolentinus lepideus HHB14362 ss-1 TaxID=1314782 RepID=A0A165UH47_9AGAM|nr:Mob1/phocein [Neolentinus lepideus HHB14362 ss-1]
MSVTVQRPLRGSRISTFYPVKILPSISSLDSAFQLQEYISLLIRADPHDVDRIVSVPGKPVSKEKDASSTEEDAKSDDKEIKGEITVDEACWIYEQLRRDLTHPLITMLQQECTRASCPEMKAGEWLYLCVAHGNDGAMEQCCAIDYILHTLDSATALLNSPRAFPSRLSIPQTSTRHFSALARRLGRIFAHAYFHHREAFEQAEAESSLYARFLVLTKKFDLVPAEFLVIPAGHEEVEPPRLLAAALHPQRDDRPRSPPGPADNGRNESPRKMGRSRTDTMVFSEAVNFAEELKGDSDGERHSGLAVPRTPGTIVGSTSPFALQPVADIQSSSVPESSAADPIVIPEGESETPSTEAEAPTEDSAKPDDTTFVMLAPPAEVCEPYPPVEGEDKPTVEGEDKPTVEGEDKPTLDEDVAKAEEQVPVTEADITDSVESEVLAADEPFEVPSSETATESEPVPDAESSAVDEEGNTLDSAEATEELKITIDYETPQTDSSPDS